MELKIKLSTGKEVELTLDELREVFTLKQDFGNQGYPYLYSHPWKWGSYHTTLPGTFYFDCPVAMTGGTDCQGRPWTTAGSLV